MCYFYLHGCVFVTYLCAQPHLNSIDDPYIIQHSGKSIRRAFFFLLLAPRLEHLACCLCCISLYLYNLIWIIISRGDFLAWYTRGILRISWNERLGCVLSTLVYCKRYLKTPGYQMFFSFHLIWSELVCSY